MKTGKGMGREKGYMRSLVLSKSWGLAFFQDLFILTTVLIGITTVLFVITTVLMLHEDGRERWFVPSLGELGPSSFPMTTVFPAADCRIMKIRCRIILYSPCPDKKNSFLTCFGSSSNGFFTAVFSVEKVFWSEKMYGAEM